MKKQRSSVVWNFFERIEEHGRCVAVGCKLCEKQYKYFGNTTNLRSHLTYKHPIQWELSQNTTGYRLVDDESSSIKRKYKDKNVRYSVSLAKPKPSETEGMPRLEIQRVDVLGGGDSESETLEETETVNIVTRNSDEEWLEDESFQTSHVESYEATPKRMKIRKIKREVVSPTHQQGYVKKFTKPIVIENKKDEYSVFGEYVANKLRKFKLPRTRGNLQQMITTILWQAEYGVYDHADSVKGVLMHKFNADTPKTEGSNIPKLQVQVSSEDVDEDQS